MPYVKPQKTTKVHLASDRQYWIEWRPSLKYGELRSASQSATTRNARGEMETDRLALSDAMLLAHIVDWNLDDEKGEKLPLTPESLSLLDEVDANQLSLLIAERAENQESERKNS